MDLSGARALSWYVGYMNGCYAVGVVILLVAVLWKFWDLVNGIEKLVTVFGDKAPAANVAPLGDSVNRVDESGPIHPISIAQWSSRASVPPLAIKKRYVGLNTADRPSIVVRGCRRNISREQWLNTQRQLQSCFADMSARPSFPLDSSCPPTNWVEVLKAAFQQTGSSTYSNVGQQQQQPCSAPPQNQHSLPQTQASSSVPAAAAGELLNPDLVLQQLDPQLVEMLTNCMGPKPNVIAGGSQNALNNSMATSPVGVCCDTLVRPQNQVPSDPISILNTILGPIMRAHIEHVKQEYAKSSAAPVDSAAQQSSKSAPSSSASASVSSCSISPLPPGEK